MKIPTNRKVLSNTIKELDEMDLVFLREMLVSRCEEVLNNKEQVKADLQFSFISPKLYIDSMENILNKIKFEDEIWKKNI
jgi:hypothetical protein